MAELDLHLFRLLYAGESPARWALSGMVALTILGSGWTLFALAPLLAMPRTRRWAAALLGTFLVTAALVQALKHAVGRARPCVTVAGVHALFGAPTDPSFPSGHAAGAFALAGFVAALMVGRASRGVALGVTLATAALAAGVALSRVYLGCHFPTDVLVGALLGAAVGWGGARLNGRAQSSAYLR